MKIIKNWNNVLEEIDHDDNKYYDNRYDLTLEDVAEVILNLQNKIEQLERQLGE